MIDEHYEDPALARLYDSTVAGPPTVSLLVVGERSLRREPRPILHMLELPDWATGGSRSKAP